MRYLLVAMLVVAAAGACRAQSVVVRVGVTPADVAGVGRARSGVVRVGMTPDDVAAALGEPLYVALSPRRIDAYYYEQLDVLGSRHEMYVNFDEAGRVYQATTDYYPFAARPPWLEQVWDAFKPAGK